MLRTPAVLAQDLRIEVWSCPPSSDDLRGTLMGSEESRGVGLQEAREEAKRLLVAFLEAAPERKQSVVRAQLIEPETGRVRAMRHSTSGIQLEWRWDPERQELLAVGEAISSN
jgi:hypothetical protein